MATGTAAGAAAALSAGDGVKPRDVKFAELQKTLANKELKATL
jgi:hypothetical protein